MDFALGLGRVQIHAELGKGRSGEQGYEASQQLDQRLHVLTLPVSTLVMPEFGDPDNP